jgi:hypothetical protein
LKSDHRIEFRLSFSPWFSFPFGKTDSVDCAEEFSTGLTDTFRESEALSTVDGLSATEGSVTALTVSFFSFIAFLPATLFSEEFVESRFLAVFSAGLRLSDFTL